MFFIVEGIVTLVSALQFLNASPPISVTPSGIVSFKILVDSNAPLLIPTSPLPKDTVDKLPHSLNDSYPI
jgi:hypothetical protein